jgi:uncharacterized protein
LVIAAMEWLGVAKIGFHHAASPLRLEAKDGSMTTLAKICEEVTPPCHLNPLLFNGDVQTMWTAVSKRGPEIHYRRKVFDGVYEAFPGSFAVDFVVDAYPDSEHDPTLPPRTACFSDEAWASIGSDDDRPMLVMLHGLSGGSYEVYLRFVIESVMQSQGNWAICVLNARGCANSVMTSGLTFNAGATWDIRQVCCHVEALSSAARCSFVMVVDGGLGKGDIPQPAPVCRWLLSGRGHFDQCKSPASQAIHPWPAFACIVFAS